ncbi:Ig-like domain-containing protein [Mycetocola spongiae]|uniref:Ig-like domain-containing protein n=1 Tax=Mycetocola spongiae TaxID=2859226 RepID=UPI001CF55E39|nr:Ig-like domain-containing protein [Mycetocola spongiae]UCR89977.1 hypothetical protein KXZ72_04750 [Mycetocola spongiae]
MIQSESTCRAMPRPHNGPQLLSIFCVISLFFLSLGVLGPGAAQASPAPPGGGSTLDVAIPFGGSASQSFPEGWSALECPSGTSPNLIAVHCAGDRVEFGASGYLADQEPQPVTIILSDAGARQTLTYRVSLAPPALSVNTGGSYGIPLAQGTPAVIPYADLRVSCDACGATLPEFRSPSVDPSEAGILRFAATGLEFRPAPDFSGAATVGFTVLDGTGQESAPAQLVLAIRPAGGPTPTTVTDLMGVEAGTTAVGNALDNDLRPPADSSALVSCGRPGNGIVRCTPDGGYTYSPNPGFSGVDQFSYRLFSEHTGENTVGSVLVGVGVDPHPAAEVAPGTSIRPLLARPGISAPPPGSVGSFTLFREVIANVSGPLA